MSRKYSYLVFFVLFLELLLLQGCITAGMRSGVTKGKERSVRFVGKGKEALPEHSSELQRVADLIMGGDELKDSIQNFTPVAHAATTDYMSGKNLITSPHRSTKEFSFDQKDKLDLGAHEMCASGTRLNPSLASIYNNSDREGRVTWYGLLEACLGIQESGVHWDEGSSRWRMKDSAASGTNRKKVVGGFFSIDTDARKNPDIMDACIHQWNSENRGYSIQDSKFQPSGGYSLDAISTNEKESLKGQEFNIRCGTLMMSMQALYQINSGQCLNPFDSTLNHFGPLRRSDEAREIQGCMTGLVLGRSALRGVSLVDIRRDLHRLAMERRKGETGKGLMDRLNKSEDERELVDSTPRKMPHMTRGKLIGV